VSPFKDGDPVIYSTHAREYYATVIGNPILVGKNRIGGAITPGHRIWLWDFTRAHRDRMRARYAGWNRENPTVRYRPRLVADYNLRHDTEPRP
jgi:hypothetical protein